MARRVSQVDEFFGERVEDPYRWLEDGGAEVAEWVRRQNEVCRAYLSSLPARVSVAARLRQLWNRERWGVPFRKGDTYFFTHNDGLQEHDILYRSRAPRGERHVVVDPNRFSSDATVALGSFHVAPNGRHVAYSISDGGSDWRLWRIRNVETGRDLDEELRDTKFTGVSWARDSRSFFYSRYPQRSGTADDTVSVAVYRHWLGSPQREDEPIYALPDQPRHNPYAAVTEDGRFLVIHVHHGFDANAVHLMRVDDLDAGALRILDEWDAIYSFVGNQGGTLFFHTTRDAARYAVATLDADGVYPGRWRGLIPETSDTLEGVRLVGGRLIARYLRDAHAAVRVFDTDGRALAEPELPGLGTVTGFGGHAAEPETFFSFTSFTEPSTIYRYDVFSGVCERLGEPVREAPGQEEPGCYETHQVWASSRDGTRIPVFVVGRTDLKDEPHPTLLYGYGGFGVPLTPSYDPALMLWLERGGRVAVPCLRGGGEYGEAWHQAGTRLRKQSVFDDLAASAEYLISQGLTSAPQLGVQGGSNGGLLVGAAITQRPELFGAAIAVVGVLDMLRYHLPSANARAWSSEYGLSENELEYRALRAYSPYHNIHEGTHYPGMLISTGDHDDRVVPWHSYKFAAALQVAQGGAGPILLRVETRAGHGAGTPTGTRMEAAADRLAFLADRLGWGSGTGAASAPVDLDSSASSD
jgi:prolyl oligopeptidase